MQDMNLGTYGMGGRIAAIRKAKGWTQAQLAERMGVSVQAVSKWETGASWPDVTTLPRLAGELGVSIDWLFGQDTKDPDPEHVFRKEAEEAAAPEDAAGGHETDGSAGTGFVFSDAPEEPIGETAEPDSHEWEPRDPEAKASIELQLHGVAEVEVAAGTGGKWTWDLKGAPELTEKIEIRTQGYHLKLVDRTASGSFSIFGLRTLFRSERTLKVTLYSPADVLEDVQVRKRGTSKLTIQPTIERIDLTSAGAGDIELYQVADGTINSKGVGDLHIHALDSCEITSGGVGDLRIEEITGRLKVTQSGVGDIKISRGYIEDLIVKKSGVGDFRAPDVEVMGCDLSVSGVGDVRLGKVHEVRRQHTSGIASVKFN